VSADLSFPQTSAIGSFSRWFEGKFPEEIPKWRTIGREAEYPITRNNGWPIPIMQVWPHLMGDDLVVKKEGDLITALEGEKYIYSSEVGWGTVEVITGPCDDLHELCAIHEEAMARLVGALEKVEACVLGYGIQPLTMLHPGLMMKKQRYGALLEAIGQDWLTFALTASDQVHVDIARSEIIDMTNLGNMLTPITVALCGNSPIYTSLDSGFCSGREHIMGGIHAADGRHGMPNLPYTSVTDMITQLVAQPFLIEKKDGIAVPNKKPFLAFIDEAAAAGMPSADLLEAFLLHEHYIWNSARPRARQATIELRSACQQPWPDHMAATALGLGMIEAGMKIHDFLFSFAVAPVAPRAPYGVRQPPDPDRVPWDQWSQIKAYHSKAVAYGLAAEEPITGMVEGVLQLCDEALQARGRGEEVYLEPLWRRLKAKENPAQVIRRIFGTRGEAAMIDALRVKL
jgi:gamma-glutamyl:cysteine ligase YbdK (ATP-grasp superfamily)